MAFFLIIGCMFAGASAIAGYGFMLVRSSPRGERPGWVWRAALVVLVIADAILVLAFLLAVAVYNCHGRYECPF